jgi:FkbM family methyltransferase
MGAHRGTEASVYDWFHKPVIWFEANSYIMQDLNDHVRQYPNQKVIHSLIGNVDNIDTNFNISNNDAASSSVFKFGKDVKSENLKMVSNIKLKTKKFDSLVKEYLIDISNFDFWVLDLQGSELMALEGSEKSLEKCNSLLIEISKDEQYLNASRWEDIKKFLYRFNFYPNEEPKDTHSDILFIKRK